MTTFQTDRQYKVQCGIPITKKSDGYLTIKIVKRTESFIFYKVIGIVTNGGTVENTIYRAKIRGGRPNGCGSRMSAINRSCVRSESILINQNWAYYPTYETKGPEYVSIHISARDHLVDSLTA